MHSTLSSAKAASPPSASCRTSPLLPPKTRAAVQTRFMRSRDEQVASREAERTPFDPLSSRAALSSLDELMQGTMSNMSQHAQDSLGWLRHAFQDPDDFSASAIGRMVSKEYGRHERPHTDHHMWRSPGTSPASSPTAQQAAAAPTTGHAAAAASATGQQQQQQGVRWGWGRGPVSSSTEGEVYQSPPSGPGFLLKQQKHQE